jgi:AbrB family looped-hinge helix DNA binding protein
MSQVEFTSVSSRGQVVIPNDIRKQMGLEEGTKLMVFSDGVNLLMKPILPPSAASFKKLIRDSHRYAKEAGLKKSDVEESIQKVRRSARRP